jgi:hypothetical protein
MGMTYFGQDFGSFDTDSPVLHCPRCQCLLVLHQPDPELWDRLLATCEKCKSWFLANHRGLTSGALTANFEDRESTGLTG